MRPEGRTSAETNLFRSSFSPSRCSVAFEPLTAFAEIETYVLPAAVMGVGVERSRRLGFGWELALTAGMAFGKGRDGQHGCENKEQRFTKWQLGDRTGLKRKQRTAMKATGTPAGCDWN